MFRRWLASVKTNPTRVHSVASRYRTTKQSRERQSTKIGVQHRQFYLPENDLIELLVELRSHYRLQEDGNTPISDEFVTFYDTEDFRCFLDAQHNSRPRHTIQLRQRTKSGQTTLEIASRLQNRTCKRRYKCANRTAELGPDEHTKLADHLDFRSHNLVPKVSVALKRFTLVAPSGEEFIRIQSDLCFSDSREQQKESNFAFVALKLSPNCSSPFLNAIGSYGYSASRSSLFEEAIRSMYPDATKPARIQTSQNAASSMELAI